MKHIREYYEYITEGKTQFKYVLKDSKNFNPFDLLNDLKAHGAELLTSNPLPRKKGMTELLIAMDNSKKDDVEEILKKHGDIEAES